MKLLNGKPSPEKSETMSFRVQDSAECKIVEDNKCLQQVRNSKYIGYEISCDNENSTQQKFEKFAQIQGA
jgi:hypothetical protein